MHHEIELLGNLGRDPEMRYTPSGQAVTNFNVATNRQYTTSDGDQVKETHWFRCSAWGKTAENVNQYLKKGSGVFVKGRLICDPDTGGPKLWLRQDGTQAASFEVNVSFVKFLPKGNGEGGDDYAERAQAARQAAGPTSGEPEDIPF
jgi:single-strand DNA-binding protein